MKVEVFKSVELVEDCQCQEFPREKYKTGHFGGTPSDIEFVREESKVRIIQERRAVSKRIPERYRCIEIKHLIEDGFRPMEEMLTPPDPHVSFFEKVKKFVIADKFTDEAFEDVERHNQSKDFTLEAYKFLVIDQISEINKLIYELRSKNEVVGNYRYENKQLENEIKYLKSRNIFQRIFRWGKYGK